MRYRGSTSINVRLRRLSRLAMLFAVALLAAVEVVGQATPTGASPVAAVPAYRQADRVALLPVHGEIDQMSLRSLERRIAEARSRGATAIVLEINTPGGRMDSTLDICTLLKDRNETPANTVAWIRPNAYSAGTFMALACREIVVASNASFGDAAPVSAGILMALPPAERAKIEAVGLAEVVDSARRNHYDEKLVQAFVSVGVALWMVEHVDSGERAFIDRNEYELLFGSEPPKQMTPVTPGQPGKTVSPVSPWLERILSGQRSTPGQHGPMGSAPETPMTDEEVQRQVEYEQSLPSLRPTFTKADGPKWRLVGQVDTDDRLLVVRTAEALDYGLGRAVIDTEAELQAYFGAKEIIRLDMQWSEHLVRFLSSMLVRGVLIAVFIIALFLELSAPGVGVFGATALVSALLLIGAPMLAGMAQWWEVLLIVLGLLLVAVELFLLPGMGVAGILGVVSLLVGLVGTFVSGDLATPQGQSELWAGLGTTFTALFAAGIGLWIASRYIHTFPLFNRFVLRAEIEGSAGRRPTQPTGLLESMSATQRALASGDVGRATTDLRPSGRADFGGRIVDVQTSGGYVARGSAVRVTAVGRMVIEVEEAEA